MLLINTGRAAKGNTHRVQRNRIMRRQFDKHFLSVGVGQKIFRMHFKPSASGSGGYHLRQIRKTETDSWSVRNGCHKGSHPISVVSLFGGFAAADDPLAIS